MTRLISAILTAACLSMGGGPLSAQDFQQGVLQSQVLMIDSDRFFSDSAFGKRVSAEVEAEGANIAAENRRIEAELTDEEKALTDKRPTLPATEFRALADAFDEKVQTLRREQDAKARALGQRGDEARRRFLLAARPVLGDLMRDAGALIILERRGVFLASDAIDITDEAIAKIDAALGDGSDLTPPEE
ncbi:OmpH family outer membrane protein [Mesobacterium sp. TK19101]|uniref:OmpH family outer membrane protein n=1 Tax=Mesobacterium hydrothermale TaxID=3111907 RepID=A0ABU6HDM2_9RHOB|nr:OmpH family outer membrane protein [Mesobacterium sp. TK19101]MEC3860563.1 OmpH family outer membrane protein [Mesobacterium sp. TK19101]